MPSDPRPIPYWPVSGFPVPFQFKPVFDTRAGSGGVNSVEIMEVYWEDLEAALVALLGYSWRDTSFIPARLKRKLPWQHPYFNQLFVKDVTHVAGVQPVGNSSQEPSDTFSPRQGGVGQGYASNLGPWSEFARADITIQFQRPNYFVRSDLDILDTFGLPQEWLRYLDKDWRVTSSILSRDAAQFVWSGGGSTPGLPGGLGQSVTRMELRKRWYELPEAAVFSMIGSVPIGIPQNLSFTQTATINPITGYTWPALSSMLDTVNTPIGTGFQLQAANTHSNKTIDGLTSTAGMSIGDCVSTPVNSVVVGGATVPVVPTGTYVTAINSGTSISVSFAAVASTSVSLYIVSDPPDNRMFGCPMGTLLYKGMVPNQRSLQLPPYLMAIPYFANNEAIAQVQYDVDLVFQYFDPPTRYPYAPKGHNLMPYPVDGLWYPINSQAAFGRVTTPFQYSDPSDLFQIV